MKSILVVCVVLLFIGGNVFFATKLVKSRKALASLQLDPLRLSLSKESSIKSANFIIFGDSLAALWNPEPDIDGLENLGIQGQTSAQLKLRAEKELVDVDANYIVLLAGGNDLKAIALFPNRSDEIVDKAVANIKSIANALEGQKLIIATTPPLFKLPFRYRFFDHQKAKEAQVLLNEKLREMKGRNVKILDLYGLFEPRVELQQFSDDGVHLNSKAYEIVNAELRRLIADW